MEPEHWNQPPPPFFLSSPGSTPPGKEREEGADDSNRKVEDEGHLGLELCGAEAGWVEAISIKYPARPSVRWAPHLHRAEDVMHHPGARVPAHRWRREHAGDGEWRGAACDGRPCSHSSSEEVSQAPGAVVDGTAHEDASATSLLDSHLTVGKDDGHDRNGSKREA